MNNAVGHSHVLRHGDRTKAIQPLRNNHHVFKFRDFEFLLLVRCNCSLRLIVIVTSRLISLFVWFAN